MKCKNRPKVKMPMMHITCQIFMLSKSEFNILNNFGIMSYRLTDEHILKTFYKSTHLKATPCFLLLDVLITGAAIPYIGHHVRLRLQIFQRRSFHTEEDQNGNRHNLLHKTNGEYYHTKARPLSINAAITPRIAHRWE